MSRYLGSSRGFLSPEMHLFVTLASFRRQSARCARSSQDWGVAGIGVMRVGCRRYSLVKLRRCSRRSPVMLSRLVCGAPANVVLDLIKLTTTSVDAASLLGGVVYWSFLRRTDGFLVLLARRLKCA
uniref:Uncharacterized protein n=1 Tax=Aegilops tauschii subsp. strangulata TaxID=200361 RepID=A0A453KA95_AEGTS